MIRCLKLKYWQPNLEQDMLSAVRYREFKLHTIYLISSEE